MSRVRPQLLRLAVALCLSLVVQLGFAQIPESISFQGLLTKPTGVPVDSTVDIAFVLYDTSGTPVWTETWEDVGVSGGIYSVRLGSLVGFDLMDFNQPLSLGIQVGEDPEMVPRTPFDSVPYAFRTANDCPAPFCEDLGLTTCFDTCADLTSDEQNCGECSALCGSGLKCVGSTCQLTCQVGLTNCNGICVNRNTDEANCGTCGNPCAAGQVCSGGGCQLTCQAGLTNCSQVCVNKNTDEANCGACGNPCAAGELCVGGTCQVSCQAGLTNCSGSCVDRNWDPQHCGTCPNVCAGDQWCDNGTCVPQ